MSIDNFKQQNDEMTELEISRQCFNAIVETTCDGILVLDAKGRVLYGNPSAGALFNSSVQALVGTELQMPALEGDAAEIEMARPDNGAGHVLMRVQRTTWCGQSARLVVLKDITERKETEAELECTRQAQLRMKDEFLSRVSHELRSPLTAVYQYVTILLDGLAGEINAEQREYLGIALRNVRQLKGMIGDLLDVTRTKSGKLVVVPREMNLLENIEAAMDTARPNAQAKGLALAVQVEEGLPSASADPQRVQQILVNLVDNAIKFTPAGGTVRVRAKIGEALPEKPGAEGNASLTAETASWLEISVADTGCGIAAEDHERIFQQLYQVDKNIDQKRMGLGLGLYICRELVCLLGGRIWVDSRAGEGSTFCFTLPAYSPEHAVRSLILDRLAQAKESGERFSVVVVDADAAVDAVRPVWEALLVAVREKAFVAGYAGKRFVVLADAGETQAERVRNRVRRLAKEACFAVAPKMPLSLSYGVAVSCADTDSAETLLARAVTAAVSERSLMGEKRLIVVDDDEACLRLLYRCMASLGVGSLRTATSGAGLFAAIEEEVPDLIVVDIQMPGMNGHEIIGRLKENAVTAVIPIVVVSGYGDERSGIGHKAPGTAIPVLSKLNMSEVQRWVQYLL
jgi:signal transduction histidine kinase/CheY-like chemotaxis protein